MGVPPTHRRCLNQYRLWGTRDEPITSAVRALRGPGQQLRLCVNLEAPAHRLLSVTTMTGETIGYIPRPFARNLASRIISGEQALVTLVSSSRARVRPVPLVAVEFTGTSDAPEGRQHSASHGSWVSAAVTDAPQRSSPPSTVPRDGCLAVFVTAFSAVLHFVMTHR
jgi:hypothetical protein